MEQRHIVAVWVLAGAQAWALDAAALQQPDGTVIPVGNSLQTLFTGRGEGIDALADAVTVPETFVPSCALTFEVVQRNAGYSNSFGWYNVTGQKPAPSDLHEFLSCNDGVGTIKVLSIKNDPNYAGGEIGFYEATGPGCPTALASESLFFSEKGYNPDGSQQDPYIHLLTYNSTVVGQAFYFAWEDKLTGNDNDFDDLTTFVTGITCTGGGAPCDTGLLGICANGIMQCQSGVLTCLQQVQPQTEQCDGFDNDCNDLVDEGDLCPPGEVCDQGNCVPECGSGEFTCDVGEVCNQDKLCIDEDCVDVDCPTGTKCVEGDCVGPCDGVTCPYGQLCQLGVCLDPCAVIQCDQGQVCEAGVCLDHCDCRGCTAGTTCQVDGHCIPDACVGVMCGPAEHCDDQGACVDDCAGAVCPHGQICQVGACVDDPGAGGGGSGSGGSFVGAGGSGAAGAAGAGGQGGGSGGGGAAKGGGAEGSDSGCSCRTVAGGERSSAPLWWMLAVGALFVRARRVRR